MQINDSDTLFGATLHNQIFEYSLIRRQVRERKPEHRLNSPSDVARFLTEIGLHQHEQEHLVAVILDSKQQIKGYTTVTIGLIDRAPMHAREVFRTAIALGASKLILAHNHPSGNPTPSQQDIRGTRELVKAGEIVGINIVDHIIIADPAPGSPGYASLRELGLM